MQFYKTTSLFNRKTDDKGGIYLMNDINNKNIVYCYDSKGSLKSIKTFDTLEECFNFVSEQNKKYTMNVKKHNKNENQFLQLDLF